MTRGFVQERCKEATAPVEGHSRIPFLLCFMPTSHLLRKCVHGALRSCFASPSLGSAHRHCAQLAVLDPVPAAETDANLHRRLQEMREAKGSLFQGEMNSSRRGGLLEGKQGVGGRERETKREGEREGEGEGEGALDWRELVARVREERRKEALSGDVVLTDSFRYVSLGWLVSMLSSSV